MKKIIVIGGGAAGLTAAINAKRDNNEVIIIERQNNIGKKILVTGNGKCNYFNQNMNASFYHTSSNYDLSNIINDNNITKVMKFMNSLGIEENIKNGYYYPHSSQAISVVNTLNKELINKGIEVIIDEIVKDIEKVNDTFYVKTNMNNYECDVVIFATGSKAYYKFDNNSYDILEKLGHKIVKVLPSLVQIKCNGKYFKDIKGVRTNANLKLYIDDILVKESSGELQVTEYGISGICAMQLSGLSAIGIDQDKKVNIKINFLDDLFKSKEEFKVYLLNKNINRSISELLDNLLNYKLTNMFINMCSLNGDELISYIDNNKLDKLVELVTNFSVDVVGVNDYLEAQVCSGGVLLDDVDFPRMESKLIKNLFLAGEVLDVDGDCGGYNLGFAWISGILAGESAGDSND